jgi:hypothetical protein
MIIYLDALYRNSTKHFFYHLHGAHFRNLDICCYNSPSLSQAYYHK